MFLKQMNFKFCKQINYVLFSYVEKNNLYGAQTRLRERSPFTFRHASVYTENEKKWLDQHKHTGLIMDK